jgi:hypothetical protein
MFRSVKSIIPTMFFSPTMPYSLREDTEDDKAEREAE